MYLNQNVVISQPYIITPHDSLLTLNALQILKWITYYYYPGEILEELFKSQGNFIFEDILSE